MILNRTKGPIFGGIYASRLANHFEIAIRHDERDGMLLPTSYLDYNNMVAHDFIRHDKEKRLIYNLVFSENTFQIITLLAPIFRYSFRKVLHFSRGHSCILGGDTIPTSRARAIT